MSKVSAVKLLGLLGATCSAIALAIGGSYNEAIGIMAAALSSAGLIQRA